MITRVMAQADLKEAAGALEAAARAVSDDDWGAASSLILAALGTCAGLVQRCAERAGADICAGKAHDNSGQNLGKHFI